MKKVLFTLLILFNVSLFSQSDTLYFPFDDFEDLDDTTTLWHAPWLSFADATEGSGFDFQFSDFETNGGSAGSIYITGQFASYGGVAAFFHRSQTVPKNLSFDGISFYAFSPVNEPNPVKFRIREKKAENERGWNYLGYNFTPPTEWGKVIFPFDSLKLTWADPAAVPFSLEDVYAIDFGSTKSNSPIDVFIDDIAFYKVLEVGDSLIFDDFEDVDSINTLWGGSWMVFSDGNAASDITGEITELETNNDSYGAVHVWGQYASYGGYVTNLNTAGGDVNLKSIDGFSFYARGDEANPVFIRLRERKAETQRSWSYFGYKFTPNPDWTYYYVPFDSLTLVYGGEANPPFSTEDIYAFDIGPAAGATNINVYVDDITFHKKGTSTAVEYTDNNLPSEYALDQNYPNPFNPVTTIKFGVAQSGFVSLKIYDIIGRELAVLINEDMQPGNYTTNFDASHLSSGIYLYELNVNGVSLTNKMMLLK